MPGPSVWRTSGLFCSSCLTRRAARSLSTRFDHNQVVRCVFRLHPNTGERVLRQLTCTKPGACRISTISTVTDHPTS